MDDWGTQSNRCLAPEELNPQEREEGCLCGKEPHRGERSPPEGSGYSSHLGRRNRVADLPPHQELVRGSSPFPKQGTTADVNPGDRRGGTTRYSWRTAMPPTLNTTLPRGFQNLKKMRRPLKILILKIHQN